MDLKTNIETHFCLYNKEKGEKMFLDLLSLFICSTLPVTPNCITEVKPLLAK